jgi:hypothetical protein
MYCTDISEQEEGNFRALFGATTLGILLCPLKSFSCQIDDGITDSRSTSSVIPIVNRVCLDLVAPFSFRFDAFLHDFNHSPFPVILRLGFLDDRSKDIRCSAHPDSNINKHCGVSTCFPASWVVAGLA